MKYKIGAKRRRIIMPNKIDLHMHSTASDGTDTPLQLAEIVQSAGITIFALTDHDTVAGAIKVSYAGRDEIRPGYRVFLPHAVR